MPMEANDNPAPSTSGRRHRRKSSALPIVLICIFAAVLLGVVIFFFTRTPPQAAAPEPSPTVAATPPAVTEPAPTPPPAPTPTPEPEPVYDFSLPAPETEAAVEEAYFADAVFLGDSRTDGLKLFGGVNAGASFIEHTGIMVFEVDNPKKGVRVDGKQYSVMDALALRQYGKVYVMYGVNELGYGDDAAFEAEFGSFVDRVRAIQPNAVLYIQNLVSINPEKAAANGQPAYVTNEKIAVYNEILARVAADKRAVLVDVNAALVDPETGVIPKEGTTDGVHFSKDYYKKWYEYLKTHTVDADLYWAGQAAEGGE